MLPCNLYFNHTLSQCHQHHLGTCDNFKISELTLSLKNQSLPLSEIPGGSVHRGLLQTELLQGQNLL
jgi:hypothetical protein